MNKLTINQQPIGTIIVARWMADFNCIKCYPSSHLTQMVPVTGIEPVRCFHHGILSPVCLPIPPHRQVWFILKDDISIFFHVYIMQLKFYLLIKNIINSLH